MDSKKEMRFSDANSSKDGDLVVAVAKRSYECTFCKRGFTNSQALGGHMNIHRKDRAKAKQSTTASSVKDYMINVNHRYFSELSRCNPVVEGNKNYGMFFLSLGSSPTHHYRDYDSDYAVRRSLQPSSLNHDELLGANLSLRIDSGETEQVRRRIMKEDEVDLELRLGYDP
ncbi:hypothetical protein SLE2022_168830 [Rubroshorea leprosula]